MDNETRQYNKRYKEETIIYIKDNQKEDSQYGGKTEQVKA